MSYTWRRSLVALALTAMLCLAPAGASAGPFAVSEERTPRAWVRPMLIEPVLEIWRHLFAVWQGLDESRGVEPAGEEDSGCSLDPDGCAAGQDRGGASLDPDG